MSAAIIREALAMVTRRALQHWSGVYVRTNDEAVAVHSMAARS
jgi:hypothetical protein